MEPDKEKGIMEIVKEIGPILKKHIMWPVRILALLGVLSIFFSSIGFDLWHILNITAPELLISVSLLFFWLSIEIINKVPELIEKSLSKLSSQLSIISTYSKEVNKEIENKIVKHKKVDIFAYTAETLDKYLPEAHAYEGEAKTIRLLTRNWDVEKEYEDKWNKEKTLLDDRERRWDKSGKMEHVSNALNERYRGIANITIEQRFYDEAPLFRCYIFGDEEYKEAYIGFYEWQEKPKRGSPYKGVNQPLFHITNETILGKKMLDIIVSRFNHCYRHSKTSTEL